MMVKVVKPKASSTPKIVYISPRRPIGDKSYESVQSSIGNYSERIVSNKFSESNSEDYDEYIDSNDESDSSHEERKTNTTFCNCLNLKSFIGISVLLSLIALLYGYSGEQCELTAVSTATLSEEFPSQVEDFWIFIQEGIEDIKKFHKPKTFIFLYTDDSHSTLEKIVNGIAELSTCNLSNCSSLPVVVEARDLSTNKLKDYGEFISKNKVKLENSGVMIVRNLERVPGASAQAFHSFCDEFNPVVGKALFIFTMKVDKLPDNNMKFVEKYLHRHWEDIKDDHFQALYTRIANVVLPIMSER